METWFECCGHLFWGSAKYIAIFFPVGFPQNPGWEFYLSCFCHVALALLLQLNYQKLTRDQSWATQILFWKFEIWNLVVDRAESY